MDKKLILAVAGSGKTYEICNQLDENKRNLILAYTNENINNIYKELLKIKHKIPENTKIITFDAFLLNYVAKPLALYVAYNNDKNFIFPDYGCVYNLPLPEFYDNKSNKYNKNYKEDKIAHYITKTGKFYGERIAKFVNKFGLIQIVAVSLKEHFDKIYIDEIQDFAGERFDVLKEIINNFNNILLVGDFNQHSVSTKVDKKKFPFVKDMNILKYKKLFKELNVEIDENSLRSSRRCSKKICNFIKRKLNIDIESLNLNTGNVIIVNDEQALEILKNNNIIKLVSQKSDDYPFLCLNWGYSKGDTLNNICVILNDNLSNFLSDDFNEKTLPNITKNKLYVALSRTCGDLYIMTYKQMKNALLMWEK